MRIAIDIQGVQSIGSSVRGIGRYSYDLIINLIKHHPDIQFILVANGALTDVRYKFKNQLQGKNVYYIDWFSPCPIDSNLKYKSQFDLATYIRSYVFSALNVDIVIITSFLEGFSDNSHTEINCEIFDIKVVSIFYDLIPYLNPNLYLNSNPEFSFFYNSKLSKMRKLDGLLAISESSKNEVIDHLKFDPKNAFNISSACDTKIFCNDNKENYHSNNHNFESLQPFLLYVGASDPRKNLKNLFEAYSQLPIQFHHYKIVLAGKLLQPEIDLIDIWIDLYKIDKNQVEKIGYVSDDDLVLLYRQCELLVFPSLHEGFGLPVLEAMSCGTPVIGSNITSIPEIIGIKQAMFDPNNVGEIRDLIIKALSDKTYKEELLINARIQSNKFSWKNTACKAIEACQKISESKNKKLDSILWQDILQDRKIKFDHLIQLINSNRDFKRNFNENVLVLIASSLDKINKQIDSFNRSIYKTKNIGSWRVEGPFDSSYSLAILNRYFVEALNQNIDNVSLHITEGPGDYDPDISYLEKFSTIQSIYEKTIEINPIYEVLSRNLYPPRVEDVNAKYNLLHSYGWEESEFPKKWVDEFNLNLEGITVMSKLVKKILIDNGVKIPIYVSGLGLDHIDNIEPDYQLNINARKYKILHVSSCFERKGLDVLLHAYGKAFTKSDDISLIIKTFENPHNRVDQLLKKFKKDYPLFPHVLVIKDEFSDSQLKGLYIQSNLLVAPSRGEGFGLPIGEAMRLGVPVIATGWGGQKDFVNNNNSWLIDYKFSPSQSHFSLDQSYWAEPSCDHLSELLLKVFYSSEVEVLAKTNAAKQITSSFTWDLVAKKNIKFVEDKLGNYDNSFVRLGCISTWNTKCGIADYAKNLLISFKKDYIVFAPFNDDYMCNDDTNIIPSWYLGKDNNCQNLIQEIKSSNINSLLIHFNYGFFDFSDLSNLIFDLKKDSINVLILLHSTIDPVDQKSKRLVDLKKALQACDRILVHSIDDLNRLKKLDIIDNVCLFPHGIVDFEPKEKNNNAFFTEKNQKNEKTISSFGFCLPNKGFSELIRAVSILRERGLNINLNIFSAIYNDDYYWVYEDLNNLVEELDLSDYVSIENKYLETNKILENLSLSDCLFFPYQSSNESSSAAVRIGLATLKPVFVTPLEIFNDISDLVNYIPGFSPQEIAKSVLHYYEGEENQSSGLKEKVKDNYQLIQDKRFAKLSIRLSNIIASLEINKLN